MGRKQACSRTWASNVKWKRHVLSLVVADATWSNLRLSKGKEGTTILGHESGPEQMKRKAKKKKEER